MYSFCVIYSGSDDLWCGLMAEFNVIPAVFLWCSVMRSGADVIVSWHDFLIIW